MLKSMKIQATYLACWSFTGEYIQKTFWACIKKSKNESRAKWDVKYQKRDESNEVLYTLCM